LFKQKWKGITQACNIGVKYLMNILRCYTAKD
jgi:hypothetical protein